MQRKYGEIWQADLNGCCYCVTFDKPIFVTRSRKQLRLEMCVEASRMHSDVWQPFSSTLWIYLILVYLTTLFNCLRYVTSNDRIFLSHGCERKWKWSWSIIMCYLGICVKGLRKTAKTSCQARGLPDRGLNPEHPDYDVEAQSLDGDIPYAGLIKTVYPNLVKCQRRMPVGRRAQQLERKRRCETVLTSYSFPVVLLFRTTMLSFSWLLIYFVQIMFRESYFWYLLTRKKWILDTCFTASAQHMNEVKLWQVSVGLYVYGSCLLNAALKPTLLRKYNVEFPKGSRTASGTA
jgi:hypothetical protein